MHIADTNQIKNGLVTDIYFERTARILKAKEIDKEVIVEIVAKGLPVRWKWAVFAGLEECTELFHDLPINVRALQEGTIFCPNEPVMEIRGRYLDFGRYETSILGLLCQASGVATMAARCRKAAGRRLVLSFGARRMHPAIAPMIERNAYIGGCDGVAGSLGARLAGMEPMGTMPHSLILLIGDTVKATKAFHEIIESKVGRVSLIDTFNDEKTEAINVAEAMGKDLLGVRLDTPGSRRGDFLKIIEEVRWELDLRGFKNVKIFLSGGLDEHQILKYNLLADAYGIGTCISNAPVVDFSMDIVEIDGKPIAKRGKMSGSKRLFRCTACFRTRVTPSPRRAGHCDCGGRMKEILIERFKNGKLLKPTPKAIEIRKFVLKQLDKVEMII